jgi:hypothetical protein
MLSARQNGCESTRFGRIITKLRLPITEMINNNFSQPINLIKEIFNTQYFAVLTSDERGQPYSNLIAFAGTDDLKSLVFFHKPEHT